MKKIFLSLIIISFMLATLLAEGDPYMGDYQGKEINANGTKEDMAAQVIAYADGEYQANIIPNFDKPWPPIVMLKGKLSGNKVVFEEQDSWSGEIKDGKFTGKFKNKSTVELEKITRKSPALGKKFSKGAIVLFDGSNMDEWKYIIKKKKPKKKKNNKKKKSPPKHPVPEKVYKEWKLIEGNAVEITPGSGSWYTKKEFGSYKLHMEFQLPFKPGAKGQARGNSGIYSFGRYEVQILDSYGLEGKDNECGGIYKAAQPRINMCYPPLQWQTYDITFIAPKFNAAGEKTANARITVIHNGVKIHDDLEVEKTGKGGIDVNEVPRAGVYLQNHGNPVQYRNIWLIELK